MARFRYRMQNILNIKQKMETQAKNEYAAANMALEEEKEKMNALIGRRKYYENKVREYLSSDSLKLQSVAEAKRAIRSIEEQMRIQLNNVKRAEKVLEEKRVAMMEVMKERKTQEILKEKAFEAFIQEENRAESKQIDELTSYLYGAKSKEE